MKTAAILTVSLLTALFLLAPATATSVYVSRVDPNLGLTAAAPWCAAAPPRVLYSYTAQTPGVPPTHVHPDGTVWAHTYLQKYDVGLENTAVGATPCVWPNGAATLQHVFLFIAT